MTFDPFGDFATRGYLRNHAGQKDLTKVKELEHEAFRGNLPRALAALNAAPRIGYGEILATRRTLFADVYPWAGEDRLRNAGDLLISRGGLKDLFAHPMHLRRAADWGLARGADPHFMRERPGAVLGALAHAHPFLDGNGRTLLTVHDEMARRAGFSILWERTAKRAYLEALTAELHAPEKAHLDTYLSQHIGPARSLGQSRAALASLPGIEGCPSRSPYMRWGAISPRRTDSRSTTR